VNNIRKSSSPNFNFRRLIGRRRYRTLAVAPMIDMIFLLLIFFLVAGKYRPQEDFLPFKLPVASAGDQNLVKPESLAVEINPTETGCCVRIAQIDMVMIDDDSSETGLALLMEKMRERMLAQKRFATDPIEIICDPNVKWQHTAAIYNVFFGAGMTDITFRMTE
jgi:biopolymer transport protein ExbD